MMVQPARTRAPRVPGLTALAAGLLLLVACASDDDGGSASGGSGGAAAGSGGTGGSGESSAGATGGTGPATSSDWTMMGYDPASTYFNRGETKITKDNAADLDVAWTRDLGSNVYSAPLQVGDRMFVAGQTVQALNAATGDPLWENPAATTSAMAYGDGVLYVHDGFGILHAINADDGVDIWQTDLSDHPDMSGFSSAILAGDHVFVGGSTGSEVSGAVPTFRGFVVAVDKGSGTIAWTSYTVGEGETGASVWSSVAVDTGASRVFAATGNNYSRPATDTSDALLAFDLATGAIEWKSQRLADDVWSRSLGAPGGAPDVGPDYDFGTNPVLFEAEVDGKMTKLVAGGQKSGDAHVVRRDTGDLVWTRNLGPGSAGGEAGIFNNMTWAGTHLLVAVNSATSSAPGSEELHALSAVPSVLFALEGGTGDILWERQLPGEVMAPITVANGVGFVGAGPVLEAFDIDTGALLKRHETSATIACIPTVANGRVAFGNGLTWSFGTPGTTLTVLELP